MFTEPREAQEYEFPAITFASGRVWQEQRRFTLQKLRDLGFGKASSEDLVADEVKDLGDVLEKRNGAPIDVRNKFNLTIVNALWRLLIGERLRHDDPKGQRIINLLDDFLKKASNPITQFVILYEPLAKFCDKFNIVNIGKTFGALMGLAKDGYAESKKNYQEDFPVTFSDHYFKHMEKKSAEAGVSSFKGQEGLVNYKNTLIDLFIAGSETTSTTLSWAILYMLLYPDVQKKVQQELDANFGRGTPPNASERGKTPYTEAVINEVQRKGNILPFSVQHAAGADTTLGGYFIPKGTVVYQNLGEVMCNEEYFPNPNKFDPTRFLDASGKNFKAHPKMMPFGVGRRRCLGESLARMELYMFFAGLLARFDVRKENEDVVLTDEPVSGTVNSPKAFKVKFVPRF